MKKKIEEVFFMLLGMIGFAIGLTILLAIIRIGELFAELITG